MHLLRNALLLVICLMLFAFWVAARLAFHVMSGGIHLLLVLAAIFLVAHFVRGRRAV